MTPDMSPWLTQFDRIASAQLRDQLAMEAAQNGPDGPTDPGPAPVTTGPWAAGPVHGADPNQPPSYLPPGPPRREPWPVLPDGQKPRKRKRIFMWVFIALQLIFLLVLILQLQGHTGPSASDIASGCYHHAWWPLFKSQHDCVVHYGSALNGAGEAGKGIGAALIIGLWVALDLILGVGRLVILTSRGRGSRGA